MDDLYVDDLVIVGVMNLRRVKPCMKKVREFYLKPDLICVKGLQIIEN